METARPCLAILELGWAGLDIEKYWFGGERGIRTLDEFLAHTPLAGERLRPLGHLSSHRHRLKPQLAETRD